MSRAEFTLAVGKAFAAAAALGLSTTTHFLRSFLRDSFLSRLLGYLAFGGFLLRRSPLCCRLSFGSFFLRSFLSFAHEQSSVFVVHTHKAGIAKTCQAKKVKFYKII